MVYVLTQYGDICGEYSWRMSWDLTHAASKKERGRKRQIKQTKIPWTSLNTPRIFLYTYYKPASSFIIGFMCRRQLFGYWNVTLKRGSPVCVIFPTDNKENLSTVRRTHITCMYERVVYHFDFCRVGCVVAFHTDAMEYVPNNSCEYAHRIVDDRMNQVWK